MTRGGFPHSDTTGSKVVRHLPGPFAAASALHRPLAPGHPPSALRVQQIRVPPRGLQTILLYRPGEGVVKESGACTAPRSPRAHTSPEASRLISTTTFRPRTSLARPRNCRGTPSGVGFT